MKEHPPSPRKIEKKKTPERESSPRAKLALVLSFLVGGAAILREALDNNPNPSDPVHLDSKKKKEANIDLVMVGRILRGLKESGGLEEDDTAAEAEVERTTDFRNIQFNKEKFRDFPLRDEPDRPFSLSLIFINRDRKFAEFLDENSEANDEFNEQVENLRFDLDENAAHLYIEGESGTDQVYVFERIEEEESGDFMGWVLKASDDELRNFHMLVSDNEEGFDPAEVQEAIRQNYQNSLLDEQAKDFPYEISFE